MPTLTLTLPGDDLDRERLAVSLGRDRWILRGILRYTGSSDGLTDGAERENEGLIRHTEETKRERAREIKNNAR